MVWRYGKLLRYLKKRVSNYYRPVSRTSQIVKLLERIVQDTIVGTVTRNNIYLILSNSANSYWTAIGTTLKKITFFFCVTRKPEGFRQDWTDFNLDFAKAFDTVPGLRLNLNLATSASLTIF